jgi:hypothetical protein
MNAEQILSRDLRKVENRLQAALRPVKPPAVFVSDLRERLDQEMVKKTKTKKVRKSLLVAGGVLGLVALVITIIRKLASWEKQAVSLARYLPKIRKREQPASI